MKPFIPSNDDGEWKPIHSFPKYKISSSGRVINPRGMELEPYINKHGYPCLCFMVGPKKRTTVTVHALVAETFIGPRPYGFHIRHLDGDSTNPRVSNLAYGTAKENIDDRTRHGTGVKGSKVNTAKLTEDQVKWYKDLFYRHLSARQANGYRKVKDGLISKIAEDLGVPVRCLIKINCGDHWRHIKAWE